jgi:DNA-binding SARP family transcriptional activator/tetratricopeptide (TPR) repeat protein
LLAFLVYARGRELGREQLFDALWGARPPARPDVALRALASKLRSTLGVSLLDGRLPTRVRIPEEAAIDIVAMEAAVVTAEAKLVHGEANGSIARARAALALDHGAFGTGLEAEWLEEARREQRELRERALEAAAEAALTADELALRRFGMTAASELSREQPYRERPHLLLMRLLDAEGGRVQALSVYDALRRRLRDELGVIPGAELRDLHRELVSDDDTASEPDTQAPRRQLELPTPLAHALRGGPPRGREQPLAAIGQHSRAASYSGRLLLVAGEAGVGKTTVVAAAAGSAYEAGSPVLYGRCEPEPLVPFAPFVEALATAASAGELATLPAPARAYLSLLIPGLDGDPELAQSELAAGALAQVRLFEAVTAAIVSLRSGDQPVLIVLDDLHWADSSSLLLLRYLTGQAAGLPLLIIGTLRDPDPDRGELLPTTLAILRRRAPLNTVHLGGLDEEAVREVISAWSQAATPAALASELAAHTRGNPLYLKAVLDHMRATRVIDSGPLPERLPAQALETVPETVRDTIAAAVRRLGDAAAAVLDAAAVLGSQFSVDEAAAVAGVRQEDAIGAVESTSLAGLTIELPGGVYSFRHALIRAALLDAISPARRSFLHMRAGQTIERGERGNHRFAELALHFGRVLRHEVAPQAVRYARAAGEEADARYAFAEAAAHYELALGALAVIEQPSSAERYELLMMLGLARFRSVGPRQARAAFGEAMKIAEHESDAERMAAAALGSGLERFLGIAGGGDMETVGALERADRALGAVDTRVKARIKVQLLLERTFLDPLPERRARSDELSVVVRRVGDPATRLEAFVVNAVALWHPSHTEELLNDLPKMLQLAARLDRPDLALHLNCTAFGWALELGRRDELYQRLAAASTAAEQLRTQIHRVRARALVITHLMLTGEFAQARASIAALLPDSRELFPEVAAEVELMWSFVLARESGDFASLLPLLQAALAAAPGQLGLRAIAAEVAVLSGDSDAARDHLARVAAHGFEDIHEDFLTLGVLSLAAGVAAELGDRELAEIVHARLVPWHDRNVILGLAAFHRPVALTLGALDHALGNPDSALKHLQAAERRGERMNAPPWRAEALHMQGRVLAALGRQPDAARAFSHAREIARSYGGELLARRAGSALAELECPETTGVAAPAVAESSGEGV